MELFKEKEITMFRNKDAIYKYIQDEVEERLSSNKHLQQSVENQIENLFRQFEHNTLCDAELYYLRFELDKIIGYTFFERIGLPRVKNEHTTAEDEVFVFSDDSIWVSQSQDSKDLNGAYEDYYFNAKELRDEFISMTDFVQDDDDVILSMFEEVVRRLLMDEGYL